MSFSKLTQESKTFPYEVCIYNVGYCKFCNKGPLPCFLTLQMGLRTFLAICQPKWSEVYCYVIGYVITKLVFQMLLNLHKKSWIDGLTLEDYGTHCSVNEKSVKEMLELAKNYNKVCNRGNFNSLRWMHSHLITVVSCKVIVLQVDLYKMTVLEAAGLLIITVCTWCWFLEWHIFHQVFFFLQSVGWVKNGAPGCRMYSGNQLVGLKWPFFGPNL